MRVLDLFASEFITQRETKSGGNISLYRDELPIENLSLLRRWKRQQAIENNPILQSPEIKMLLRGRYNWHKHAIALLVLFAGHSAREAARVSGLAKMTAYKLARQVWRVYPHIKCPCGEKPGHRGWCSTRVRRSPKRTEFLKTFGRRARRGGPDV